MTSFQIIRLLFPLVFVGYGIFLKNTEKVTLASSKKYWYLYFIFGALMFGYRLYKYLNNLNY